MDNLDKTLAILGASVCILISVSILCATVGGYYKDIRQREKIVACFQTHQSDCVLLMVNSTPN